MSNSNMSPTEHAWMPAELKTLLGLDFISVIQYQGAIEDDITNDCRKSKFVGVTFIRKPKCTRVPKTFLVCLTTESNIYVIDTNYEEHTRFLERFLDNAISDRFKLYIYKGHEAAFRLKSGFAIDIGSVVTDISTLDIFLSMRQAVISGEIKTYSVSGLMDLKIKYRDRYNLAKDHLKISLPEPTKDEQFALSDDLTSIASHNAIRKMASTTRILAVCIQGKLDKLSRIDSEIIYSFGTRASVEDFEAFETLDNHSYSRVNNRLNLIGLEDQE